MICPCCGKEWNTDINNSCICGAVITKKAPQNLAKPDAYSLLADVRAELLKELLTVFIDLLDEAKCYYHLYPNSHRGTVEEYFEIEDKLIKKVSEHFS